MTGAHNFLKRLGLLFAVSLLATLPCPLRAQSMATMPEHPMKQAAIAEQLTLSSPAQTLTFTREQLLALPQRTVTVFDAHSKKDQTYTGVGVDELLSKVGLKLDKDGSARIFHSYVRAQGTDGYYVLYSASEFEPGLHPGDSIVAVTLDGKPLLEEGRFKLVVAGEKKPARWVHNLSSLQVVSVE